MVYTKEILLALGVIGVISGCGGGGGTSTGSNGQNNSSQTGVPPASTNPADPTEGTPDVPTGGSNSTASTEQNNSVNSSEQTPVAEANITTIDVMALYTSEADASVDGGAEAKINHFFAVTNKINKDSKIDLVYRVVHMEESAELDNDLQSGDNLDLITYDKDVHALRDTHKADLVVGYIETADNCGNGWLNEYDEMREDLGYSVVPIDCSADSTAHEIGHNLGLNHSHRQDDLGRFPYSVGYGVDDEFVTVMAYADFFGDPDTALYYSNPTIIDCGMNVKQACGVPENEIEPAYAAESIRRVIADVAKFR